MPLMQERLLVKAHIIPEDAVGEMCQIYHILCYTLYYSVYLYNEALMFILTKMYFASFLNWTNYLCNTIILVCIIFLSVIVREPFLH